MKSEEEKERELIATFIEDLLGIPPYEQDNIRGTIKELAQTMIWRGWTKTEAK